MRYETIVLNEERNVTLTAMVQGVGGEFRGISDRPAVLVIPGGGYLFCSDREADPVATAYLRAGYHAFILRYSVGADAAWPRPLQDYEEAMSLIRERADEWHVILDKIAVVGFSAGGHLAGAAATLAKRRPAAAVLGYAVLRDGKLCRYLSREQAVAVGFLKNEVGPAAVQLKDRHGNTAVLEILSGESRVRPVWEDGALKGLSVSAQVRACVLELGGPRRT